jgi:hypothetical protein
MNVWYWDEERHDWLEVANSSNPKIRDLVLWAVLELDLVGVLSTEKPTRGVFNCPGCKGVGVTILSQEDYTKRFGFAPWKVEERP